MTESDPGANSGDNDPLLHPIKDVLETMDGRTIPVETTGAVGAVATGGEVASPPTAKHERPKPEKWDELVAFASTLPLYKEVNMYGRKYDDATIDTLRAKMEELLSDEELDECRYYSIGTMLCGLAQGLQDPAVRKKTAKAVGDRLVSNWKLVGTAHPNGLMPQDVDGSSTSSALAYMVSEFSNALPQHVQLVNDVLEWHANERRGAIRNGDSPADHANLGKRGPYNDRHFYAGEAVNRTTSVTAVATARVLRSILMQRAGYLARTNPDFPKEPTAQQVIDATDMDDINLEPVAQRAAAVRIDELRRLEDTYLGLDENGRAVFHGKKLPRSRDLAPPAIVDGQQVVLHTKRLRCPALFVEGLIPGVLACLVEGVGVADERIKAEQRHMRGEAGFDYDRI